MKVILVQPPMFHRKLHLAPNLGLAYIAAVLEREKIGVKIIDAAADDLSYDAIIKIISAYEPILIGVGGQTPVSSRSLTILRRVKDEVSSDIVTIAGGPHFTFTDRESLETCRELDIIVRGEGEETMKALSKRIKNGETYDDVTGITYRTKKGHILRNPEREPISDLDSLPFPAWHLFPYEKYHWAGNKMLAISSSRGCSYKCPHCITWKVHKGVRRRNPSKIVEEMIWVKKNFDHDTFFFQDDASFTERQQIVKFLDELENRNEKLYWYYETREDIFESYQDLWKRMKENGLFKIVFGLETPDPNKRIRYGKEGFDRERVEKMIDILEKKHDILVSVYLLFGLPEDTVESLEALLEYGKYLYPDHCSFIVGTMVVPFPGTEMYKDLRERELITSYNWDDYGFDKSVVRTSIPPEKISEVFREFWTGTYVRPKVFWKQLKNFFSRNRFRRSMARQYIQMALEMISDIRKIREMEKNDLSSSIDQMEKNDLSSSIDLMD